VRQAALLPRDAFGKNGFAALGQRDFVNGGTEQEKRASCERLERANRFAVSSMVSLAKPFSNCFLRCLVHFSFSFPWRSLTQAVSFTV
jgi:hypothetical protein